MTDKEIQEGNKLIAEFIGWKYNSKEYNWRHSRIDWSSWVDLKNVGHKEMFFHSSWDWLMPVVEEIEAIEVDTTPLPPRPDPMPKRLFWVSIQKSNITIAEDYKITSIAERFNYKSKIEATWECIVQFIKWYN